MRLSKEAFTVGETEVTEEELKKLNVFTGKELTADKVFVFSIKLCDNEIDRDGERFSVECLRELAALFIGKTGITDHNWSSDRQVARIFDSEVVEERNRRTETGEPYVYVKAKAYTLKTAANEEFIARIEGGINKEVSVGCAVSESICSICGNPLGGEKCSHTKGEIYGGKKCCGILNGATDAYEWSFVAVPAQRSAGVVKGMDAFEAKILSDYINKSGKIEFLHEFEVLNKQAEIGKRYMEGLKNDVVRLGMLTGIWNDESLRKLVKDMDESALLSLKENLEMKADEILPPVTQLGAYRKEKIQPEFDYMI